MDNFIHMDFSTGPSPWVSTPEIPKITASQPRPTPLRHGNHPLKHAITLWDVPQKENFSGMCWKDPTLRRKWKKERFDGVIRQAVQVNSCR
jgi:hypothetical protein